MLQIDYSTAARQHHKVAYSGVEEERWVVSDALLVTKNPVLFAVNSTYSDHTFYFSSQSTPCWCQLMAVRTHRRVEVDEPQ
jgi:hypothetical protein